MSKLRLNHTMMCYVHKDRTDQIVIEDVAKCFIMRKKTTFTLVTCKVCLFINSVSLCSLFFKAEYTQNIM